MSYIDINDVSDLHVKDICEREDVTSQLTATDREIERVSMARGVKSDDIPVDENGNTTSPALQTFGMFYLYRILLSDFWGASGRDTIQDIYFAKLEYYESEMQKARNTLTRDLILNDNVSQRSHIRSIPIY